MTPGTVVVGIIDDGIAFAHERFRKADKTRVEYWWVQDGAGAGTPPTPFDYGRELKKADIDGLLTQCTPAGVVDEDEFYVRAGLIDIRRDEHKSAAWRAAHGTHVMDLACGADPQTVGDERPIVVVQLPTAVTADTSGAALPGYAYDAMEYIIARAKDIATGTGLLPVVINLSYGLIAGPHDGTGPLPRDGTGPLEPAIDYLVTRSKDEGFPLRVVLPAGNSHLSRCHAQVSLGEDEVKLLRWRVQPDDQTPSFLEIWMPCRTGGGGESRLELTVTSPTGYSLSIDETLGAYQDWVTAAGTHAEVSYSLPVPNGRGVFLVALKPTTDLNPANALAPSGIWKVELKNRGLSGSDIVHAWIQRDDTPYGYPLRGRQSYFDEDCYQRFDEATGREIETDDLKCHVRRASLINAIATGREPIVMGGFLRREMIAAKYSAGGPVLAPCGTAAADPFRPDAMAVSEDSYVHAGVLAAGSRSGSVVAMGGTSVAAPQITRWIAGELALGSLGDRAAVRLRAKDFENTLPGDPRKPSQERGGAGRIPLTPVVAVKRFHED